LCACDRAADLTRIRDWCQAADRYIRMYGCPFVDADCKMRYGGILLSTGQWAEAERELSSAMRAAGAETFYHTEAATKLAELRLLQGRLDEADALLARLTDKPSARPVAAAVRHARGEHAVAAAMLRRYLDAREPNHLRASAALDLLV